MTDRVGLVFLLDVDNTLFDNDRFADDLTAQLERSFGAAERERYWALYAQRRARLGYADYLGTLQDFRAAQDASPQLLQMSAFLLDYPFAERLYPRALETIDGLQRIGQTVILSDGDAVFQPRKVRRSGLWDAVGGRVLIYLHKEAALESMQRHYPADHYVMVDDKPQLLTAMKRQMRERLTTVFVRQGHYALEAPAAAVAIPPDLQFERIGDLISADPGAFLAAGNA